MFKITVNNPNGQSETFDMSGMQFHEIYDKFEKNGIKASPYGYTMGDARKENAPITLSSDSDMGNAVLKLFIDKETIYDVYAVEHGLSRVPEEFRDEIEQNILNEQYRYPEYIFEDVNRMIRETSAAHETFYCPLVGNVHYAEDGDYGEVMNDTLLENVDAIEERLAREQMPEMNMAEYVGDHSGLGSKLRLAEWQVEEIGGTLYSSGCKSFASQPFDIRRLFGLIKELEDRMANVVVENQDFEALIKHYDRPDTFFYADPPYFSTEDMYAVGFGWDDHVRLRDTLAGIKGQFLLSYNDCPEIRELYEGFSLFDFSRTHSMAQRYEAGKEFKELLIANYDLYERERNRPLQMNLFDEPIDQFDYEKVLKECIISCKIRK